MEKCKKLISENNIQTKPRICEVLGVEVREPFYYVGNSTLFRVNTGRIEFCAIGKVWLSLDEPDMLQKIMFATPAKILAASRKPHLSEEEAAVLRYICNRYRIDDREGILERQPNNDLKLYGCGQEVFLPTAFFPFVLPGHSALIKDIVVDMDESV